LGIAKKQNVCRKSVIAYSLLFIVVSTWIAFTREETFAFIFFDLALVIILFLFSGQKRIILKFISILIAGTVASLCITGFAIAKQNEKFYGVASISYIQSGPLTRLVSEWSRVEPISDNPRMLISKHQRNIIYSQIPDIGVMKDQIESHLSWYSGPSCNMANICQDIGSGWTFWGLFYAFTESKNLSSPKSFNSRVLHFNSEIKRYCEISISKCDHTQVAHHWQGFKYP